MKTILLAGGAGYIGSHTAVELLNSGYNVVIVDNYSNSSPEAINRIEKITGKKVIAYEADVKDKALLSKIFEENKIDAVIHFAGLKAVGESVSKPIEYYRNNIDTTLSLLECMREYGTNSIIFSSSATVYGAENPIPYLETMKRGTCTNPYGWTKVMMEQILEDSAKANKDLSVVLLRYFNPIGAHKSGLIGEDPQGIPNNLMPYILKVAAHELECLTIFGNDYDTEDGTCIRDYIHVVDLAKGHISALNKMMSISPMICVYNLGSGNGVSVKEIVETFERVNELKLNYKYGDKREGDLAANFADASKAYLELHWKTEKTIEDMCRDAWHFKNINK